MSEHRPNLFARIKSALAPPSLVFATNASREEIQEAHTHAMQILSDFEAAPKRLIEANDIQIKQNSYSLLPRGLMAAYEFFSPDGGRTIIDASTMSGTALAFVAYWYCAVRWRAQKIAEAPLMVVAEDQNDGSDEWLPEHELVGVLDMPSEDYDMGELLERTSRYLDDTAECIWIKDVDRINRVARLTPFKKGEFRVERSDTRLFATFVVTTSDGQQTYTADQVCYFRDAYDGWTGGKSRLDVAMSWLRLGEASRQTIKDLLNNAVWPSAVVIPDAAWNPSPEQLAVYKQELENYARPGQRAKPFVQLGGGSFTALSASIKDLVPTDVLNRVESVVAAISGVPAIVLQYQIGMENSPWSQMGQARRMAYDDTIVPTWRKYERVLTRQLLRPVDEDQTHFIRFDKSNIDSLQRDQLESVQIATQMGRQASLNERRTIMGLEPATAKQDPFTRADEIPELTQPSMAQLLAAQTTNTPANTPAAGDTVPADTTTAPKKSDDKILTMLQRKAKVASLAEMLREEAFHTWGNAFHQQLQKDREAIIDIVKTFLTDATHKSVESKARGKDRAMSAVHEYFRTDGKRGWTRTAQPLMVQGAERSIAIASSDLVNVSYQVLHPSAIAFAQKNAAKMVTEVSRTTKQLINDIVTAGMQENQSTNDIANLIRDATGFSKERSLLIARTETTSIYSGAPVESLSAFSKATGRLFLKTWFGVMDDKERDEHVALEGETVGIDENFSNGLPFPSEPNCRCHALTHEVEE